MVFAQTCKISFPTNRGRSAFFIRRAEYIEATRSVKELVGKALVKLPRKLYFASGVNELIQTGDPITIELGYDERFETAFTGYVVKIKPGESVEVFCEDEMWKLKQTSVHKLLRKVSVKQLIEFIAPEYEFENSDFNLGDVKINRATPLAVLEMLRSKYSIYSFFDGKKLIVGKPYSYLDELHTFRLGEFQLPINLEYQDESEIKVKVRAQSLLANGTKLEVEVGDSAGAESKLIYSNITSISELKKLANADLEKLKRGGYKGDFEALGFVEMRPGTKLELSDIFYPERAGRYYIDAVKATFGGGGFHKTITLGWRL